MLKKKMYITGIGGLLGGNLATILSDKYDIYGLDSKNLKIPNIKSSVIDINDYQSVKMEIEHIKPDILIHCLALVDVDKCEEDKKLSYKLNYKSTEFLSKICAEKNIKLIYISTDAVFDGIKEGLYSEEDEVNPLNEYAKTKRLGELEVLKNKKNLVLRTNIYGFNIKDKFSFGEWVLNSLKENKRLNMFYDVKFSPILVNDFAKILDVIIQNELEGIIHLSSTGSISKYDFGIKLSEIFGFEENNINKFSVKEFSFKAKRSENMGLDNQKIRKILGIDIPTPEQGIKNFKELYDSGYGEQLKNYL